MKTPLTSVFLYLLIKVDLLCVQESEAFLAPRSLHSPPHTRLMTKVSLSPTKQSSTLLCAHGTSSSPRNQDTKKNIFRSLIRFLSTHFRRFLWPGLTRGFDPNLKAPLPEIAPLGCPFFGNNLLAGSRKKGPEYFYSEASAKLGHPRIWRFYFLGQPIISVSGAENVNAVLQSNKFNIASVESYAAHPENQNNDDKKKNNASLFSSNSVMFEADKKKHQFLRRLIGTAFTPFYVQKGMEKIVEAASDQISMVKNNEPIKMEDVCDAFAFDVALRQIVGLDLQEEKEIERFHKAVNTYVSGLYSIHAYMNLPFKTLTAPYRARKYLVSKIKEKIAYLEKNGPDGSTLSALVFATDEESKKKLTKEDVIENVLILLTAGTETTAGTLTSAVFFLGLHPRVFKKLILEQQELISSDGTDITRESLEKCDYLNAVIQETMRLVPVSGANLRKAEEGIILDGKQIPKGSNVFCNIRLTHELDPKTNSSMDPIDNFVPERWLDAETKPAEEFIPFGAGSRRCIGAPLAMAEIKVFLSILARKIDSFELLGVGADETSISWKKANVIPRPLDNVPIRSTLSMS